MDLRRTGWHWIAYDTFVDLYPLDDLRDHLLGDECWCNPDVDPGDEDHLPLVAHNSADRRELNEPDYQKKGNNGSSTISR